LCKRPAKLDAEKLTPDEQMRRFIEAARGWSEDEFLAAFRPAAKLTTDARP
jgi:hypothetical protein